MVSKEAAMKRLIELVKADLASANAKVNALSEELYSGFDEVKTSLSAQATAISDLESVAPNNANKNLLNCPGSFMASFRRSASEQLESNLFGGEQSLYLPYIAGGYYTLSYDCLTVDVAGTITPIGSIHWEFYDVEGNIIGRAIIKNVLGRVTHTFRADDIGECTAFSAYVTDDIEGSVSIENIQLEIGNTATPYVDSQGESNYALSKNVKKLKQGLDDLNDLNCFDLLWQNDENVKEIAPDTEYIIPEMSNYDLFRLDVVRASHPDYPLSEILGIYNFVFCEYFQQQLQFSIPADKSIFIWSRYICASCEHTRINLDNGRRFTVGNDGVSSGIDNSCFIPYKLYGLRRKKI